jgi:hypothetical protein
MLPFNASGQAAEYCRQPENRNNFQAPIPQHIHLKYCPNFAFYLYILLNVFKPYINAHPAKNFPNPFQHSRFLFYGMQCINGANAFY